MANSQKKAEDLKNAYVTGLMDQASADDMAQYAPTGGDMGDTASVTLDAAQGRTHYLNDNDPTLYFRDSGIPLRAIGTAAPNPIPSYLGDSKSSPMKPRDLINVRKLSGKIRRERGW